MLKLVIFDVDGTLVDSQELIVEAMGMAFNSAGLAAPSRTETLGIVGLSLPEAMRMLRPGAREGIISDLVAGYKSAFAEIHNRTGGEATAPFYPGAEASIARLDCAGFLLSIATGKARRGLNRMLEAHNLFSHFVATQTADDAPSKPHPGMVLNCLSGTGADASQAVMVGDTEFDMEMARAAGVRAIGVDWGYHDDHRLRRGGAETIVNSFDALEATIAEMLGTP